MFFVYFGEVPQNKNKKQNVFFFFAQQNTWSRPLGERPTSRGRVPKVPAQIPVQSDSVTQGRQASGAVPKERHTSEAQVQCRPLRGAQGCQTPDTACSRLTRSGRRPQEVATPQPEDFSSHPRKWATRTPQGVHPWSNRLLRGLSGLVRWGPHPPRLARPRRCC